MYDVSLASGAGEGQGGGSTGTRGSPELGDAWTLDVVGG